MLNVIFEGTEPLSIRCSAVPRSVQHSNFLPEFGKNAECATTAQARRGAAPYGASRCHTDIATQRGSRHAPTHNVNCSIAQDVVGNARDLRSAWTHTAARGAATQRGASTRSEVKPALGASRCLTDTAARTRNARCRHAMRGIATPSEAPGARRKQPHNARGRRCTTQEVRCAGILAPPRRAAWRNVV